MTIQPKDMDELREKLAAIEHARWSDWQQYLHNKCSDNDGGGKIIPLELYLQWKRQIDTDYLFLSEKEKDSDREQVDRYWPLIVKLLADQKAKAINLVMSDYPKSKNEEDHAAQIRGVEHAVETIATTLKDEL